MFNTLLTPGEIIHYTGISKDFPRCSLRTISMVEYHEFRTCLGIAFYEELKEAKIDYSDAVQYANGTAYNVDDVVSYEGILYKNIKASTGKIPKDDEYWILAPKFNKECFEELWCNYLAEYLSWRVIFDRIPFISTQIKAEGLVKIFGNTFQAAGSKDFETISKAILRSAERTWGNMNHFIKHHNDDGCFDLYKEIAVGCCSECGELNEECDCDDCEDSQSDGYDYAIG